MKNKKARSSTGTLLFACNLFMCVVPFLGDSLSFAACACIRQSVKAGMMQDAISPCHHT